MIMQLKKLVFLILLLESTVSTAHTLTLKHPYWSDTVNIENNRLCRNSPPKDCGTVEFKENTLIVKWDKYSPEVFHKTDENIYAFKNSILPENIEEKYKEFEYTFQEPFVLLNPYKKTPLAALIKFPTEKPAKITVTVRGENNAPDISHTFSSYKTDHNIPVFGLYANFENTVTLYARFKDNTVKKNTLKISTGNTPTNARWIVNDKKDNGFYYYATYTGDVFDEQGYLRYFFLHDGWSHVYFFKEKVFIEHVNKIQRYSLLGEHEKDYVFPAGFYTYIHGMGYKPNGNLLVFGSFNNTTALIDGKQLPTHRDFVLEFDYNTGKETARYDLAEMLNPDRSLIVKSTQYDNNKIDWAHTNGISYDAKNKAVIVSGRHFGIAKIDETAHKLIWWFTPHQQVDKSGRNGNNGSVAGKMLTAVDKHNAPYPKSVQEGTQSVPDFKWPLKTHNVFYNGNGIYAIFDNSGDLYDKTLKTTADSYASAFKIDDKKHTVRQIFMKNLKQYAATGSSAYMHPATKELWVNIDSVRDKNNKSLVSSHFMRFSPSGKQLYHAVIPNHHFYAVFPFNFYKENMPLSSN